MSHFSTLVVVQSAESLMEASSKMEAMLAPFDENINVDPYRKYEDGAATDYWAHKHLSEETGQPLTTWADLAKAYNDKYADAEDGDESERLYVDEAGRAYNLSTYNPKSKWDYYRLGGRWNGYFPIKAGALAPVFLAPRPWEFEHEGVAAGANTADLAQKRDIDWDSRALDKELDAEARYTEFEAAIAGISEEVLEAHRPWREFMALAEAQTITWDEARQAYGAQPEVAALRQAAVRPESNLGWDASFEDFFWGDGGREKYVARAKRAAFATFAVLDSEGWHERGSMGWWGVVSNEKDQDQWVDSFTQMLANLPDDAWLGVYDLHI